jgi:hypothetical protein
MPVWPSDSGGWNANIQTDVPRRYAYVPEAQFALNPTPNAVYDLTITAVVQPVDMARQVPEGPLRKYSTYIEAGALAQLLDMPGTPWSNPGMAARNAAMFKSGISNGKAEVQRNFNTGAQRVRPRPFVI